MTSWGDVASEKNCIVVSVCITEINPLRLQLYYSKESKWCQMTHPGFQWDGRKEFWEIWLPAHDAFPAETECFVAKRRNLWDVAKQEIRRWAASSFRSSRDVEMLQFHYWPYRAERGSAVTRRIHSTKFLLSSTLCCEKVTEMNKTAAYTITPLPVGAS